MSRVTLNVIANLFGQSWSALIQIVLVPFYLHFLGVESYALVGFYLMLITTVQVFDLGISQTLNRELARLSADPRGAVEMRDVVRTIETLYWGIVIGVCAALALLMPLIARHVMKPNQLDPDSLIHALYMMLIVVMLNWQTNLYFNGLMGLQRQVLVNKLRILLSTLSGGGALLSLWLISPTILMFFSWQAATGTLAVVVSAAALRRELPNTGRQPVFRKHILSRTWRFAAGVSGLMISALVLTQFDKWILIKQLTLEAFGYFSLAVAVANALSILVAPVFGAIYPRLSVLTVQRDDKIFGQVYHVSTQVVAVTAIPMAVFLSFYAHEVLLLWTGNKSVAIQAGPILSLFVLGSALNGLMHIPYARELAQGRTRIFLVFNVLAVAALSPMVWYLAPKIGAIVSAIAWIILNIAYFVIAIPLIHANMTRDEKSRWYLRDIMAPAGAATLILGIARLMLPEGLSFLPLAALLAMILTTAVTAAILTTTELRNVLKAALTQYLSGIRTRH